MDLINDGVCKRAVDFCLCCKIFLIELRKSIEFAMTYFICTGNECNNEHTCANPCLTMDPNHSIIGLLEFRKFLSSVGVAQSKCM